MEERAKTSNEELMPEKTNLMVWDNREEECKKIINAAMFACGGVATGVAQIPLSDSAIITPIQVAMIISIGKIYGLKLRESTARAMISGISGAYIGRCLSQIVIGWVPVIGNLFNTVTAATITELIGYMAMNKFKEQAERKFVA